MKRVLTLLLALAMLLSTQAVFAEMFVDSNEATASEVVEREPLPTVLRVAATTRPSGYFFTDLWGNNVSDTDVRYMLHGQSTVAWQSQTDIVVNPTVVREVRQSNLAGGDREYVFILNDGLMFSDGSSISAADYVFSILLLASDEIRGLGAAETAYSQYYGYDAYHSGESEVFAGVRLIRDNTFSVRLRGEFLPSFYEYAYLDVMPYPISVIAPECVVADDGEGAYIVNANTASLVEGEVLDAGDTPRFTSELLQETLFDADTGYVSHPNVVSGPYVLNEYIASAGSLSFTANPNFPGNHEGAKPAISNVTFTYAPSGEIIERMQAGEFELVNKCVSLDTILKGMETENNAQTYARSGYGFISFACEYGPQSSKEVRQALAYALDSDTFIQDYLANYGLAVYGYYGIGQWMAQAATGAIIPEDLTDEEQQAWDAVDLELLNKYAYDLEKAKELLASDGWTLDANGEDYVSGVRYKNVDGEILPLKLRWAKTSDTAASDKIEELIAPAFSEIGVDLVITEMPFTQMLRQYYRLDEREYDMFYMATNFNAVFDPTLTFAVDDKYQGVANTTGLRDEKLAELARNMSRVEPGDVLGFFTNWFEMQLYFNEVLPTLPIYANVYVDFSVPTLAKYEPALYLNWPTAILYAEFAYPEDELDPFLDGTAEGEGDDLFMDE